jgi:hypothetical protein
MVALTALSIRCQAVEVDLVAQSTGERVDGSRSVVPRAVEAEVDTGLDASTQRGWKSAATARVERPFTTHAVATGRDQPAQSATTS